MKTIKLPEGSVQWPIGTEVQWIGRNGCFDSIGLYIDAGLGTRIALHPVGKRGTIGNCMIEVPKAAIPDLISKLAQALTISSDSNPSAPAYSDQVTLPPVVRGQGERIPSINEAIKLDDIQIPRLDAEFMKDVVRRL